MKINLSQALQSSDEFKVRAMQVAQPQKAFKAQLETRLEYADAKEKIDDLINKIEIQGEIFKKRVDITEYKKYKDYVTTFLKEAVSNTFKFSNENYFDNNGRHRTLANVETINDNLEKLTEKVLNEQKDNFEIMKIVDDIRGMIIDLRL